MPFWHLKFVGWPALLIGSGPFVTEAHGVLFSASLGVEWPLARVGGPGMAMGTLSGVCGTFALVGALALRCGGADAPILESVEPARGLAGEATVIVLSGQGLDLRVEESGAALVAQPWTGEVGGRPLGAIVLRSSTRAEATMPMGLRPGSHDIVLRAPGHELRLSRAFTVVTPVAPRLDRATPPVLPLAGGTVRLTGAGLHRSSRVLVLGAEVPVRWIDDNALEIVAPEATVGPAHLEVVTPVGRAARGLLLRYADSM